MQVIKGKYAEAVVYTDNIEDTAYEQIKELCNQEFAKGSNIRIMPDVHAGKGCVIGFTANLGDIVIPNIVGVDIACGLISVKLGDVEIDMQKLDDIIREYIPSGPNVNNNKIVKFPRLQELHCFRDLQRTQRIERGIPSLGGGNHFLEINIDSQNNKYLVIHSGSRNLGKQVADFYQALAIDLCSGKEKYYTEKENIITSYKKDGKRDLIQAELKKLKKKYSDLKAKYPEHLCFLTGKYRDRYLHDMQICQEYASLNRVTMARIIIDKLLEKDLDEFFYFQTVHNYIDFEDNIVRKGAISAKKDELVLIPINMRDGSILAVGKGNKDWNFSASHGAGRSKSRSQSKRDITLQEFEDSMKDVWTTSVMEATIDEAPMAYKPMEEILANITDSVDIIEILKPIYNFKAN